MSFSEMSYWQQRIWCACQYLDSALLHKMTATRRVIEIRQKRKRIHILRIVTVFPTNYRYFINGGGLHMITHGSFVSSFPVLLVVSHGYAPQNYIPGAVMHKQRPQLKEAQIIWCPTPQELAAVDMTASIVTPCCTTAPGGFRVLIKAILITFFQILYLQAPAFLYVYKLSPHSSRFICPAAAGKVNKLPLEISSDSKLSLRCIMARHLWLRTCCIIQDAGFRTQKFWHSND